MIRTTLFIFSLLLSAYGPSSGPCDLEFEKNCKNSEETRVDCLQNQIAKISDVNCIKELEASKADWQKKNESFKLVKKSCDKDVDNHCPEDKESFKNYKVCLMINGEKLSPECKTEMNRHIKDHMPGINPIK